ncbi:biorientation of chromosomes in cell division protein 1-like 1 [Phlebotomus argentipes]|uniref:biorientation of chromosomes in cell division protein 1-like 1 n=1 Tax=Phlebotomus argentipes TaxID=94469 RepID=UPI002892D6B3|nr:biorientation of chromosomes in cell division protein 1-like 1 [Phlebotomus argentipes]
MEDEQVHTELVDTIVREVKSQGLFDQFRKECQADVDTKPAYQNLRQRVDTSVTTFLEQQEWRPDANRIQLREKLRKNIIGLSFLETGVDRIVDQVVNPKISTVFLPQIEDVVYKYLGIEKPQPKPNNMENGELKVDLMPTDLLEAVSPDSSKSDKSSLLAADDVKEEITEEEIVPELNESNDRIDDEESPPFEPLEGHPSSPLKKEEKEDSQDTNVSGISGLTSQDSVDSEAMEVDEVKTEAEEPEEVMQPPRIDQMVEKSEVPERTVSEVVEAMDVGNQDSQLSQVSSNSRLSIVTNESDSKDGSLKIDLSEEAQMPEFSENHDNSQSPVEKLTTFDIKKDEIKFQQARIFVQPPEPEDPPPLPPSPPPEVKPQLPAPPESRPEKKIDAEVSSSQEAKEKHHSSEKKKPKKSSRSSQHKDKAREKSRSSSSREKNAKPQEDDSSTALDSDASPVLQIVETDTMDNADLTVTKTTSDKQSSHKSSSSSSHRDDRKKSHSSHSKDSHRRDHRRHHDKHRSSSQKKKPKEESSSKKKDDHSSQREKQSEKRRSTDRDSNDGNSGPKPSSASSQPASGTGGESTNSSVSNSPQNSDTQTKQEAAAPPSDQLASSGDSGEKVVMQTKPIIVDQILTANSEINLQMIVNRASNDPTLAKIEELAKKSLAKKKPKIASNFKEAKRLMKMRKKIDLESKKNMEKAMVLAKNYINSQAENDPTVTDLSQGIELEFVCMKSIAGPIISSPIKVEAPKLPTVKAEEVTSNIDDGIGDSEPEEELLYFPDPLSKHLQSVCEKWWWEKGGKMLDDKKPKTEPKMKKSPKNGIISPPKRPADLNDIKSDLPEDKRLRLTPNKFGDLNGNEDVLEDKKSPKVKTTITQQQRYSSDDLYKPRPLIHGQRTRRRGLDAVDGV